MALLLVMMIAFAAPTPTLARDLGAPAPCTTSPSYILVFNDGRTPATHQLSVDTRDGSFELSQYTPACPDCKVVILCSGTGAKVVKGNLMIPLGKCKLGVYTPPSSSFISGGGKATGTAIVALAVLGKPRLSQLFILPRLPTCPVTFHLHNVPVESLKGFAMDEKAPSSADKGQSVAASATFYGPAATSTIKLQPGVYSYVIFGTGPEISSNTATVAIKVFRSASSVLEDIPGITPQNINGGGCARGTSCIVKNEGSWTVSSEVTLNAGDRLAVVITLTNNIFNILVDGSTPDPQDPKLNVFTDSTITVPVPG